jgi:hypothetical protein
MFDFAVFLVPTVVGLCRPSGGVVAGVIVAFASVGSVAGRRWAVASTTATGSLLALEVGYRPFVKGLSCSIPDKGDGWPWSGTRAVLKHEVSDASVHFVRDPLTAVISGYKLRPDSDGNYDLGQLGWCFVETDRWD